MTGDKVGKVTFSVICKSGYTQQRRKRYTAESISEHAQIFYLTTKHTGERHSKITDSPLLVNKTLRPQKYFMSRVEIKDLGGLVFHPVAKSKLESAYIIYKECDALNSHEFIFYAYEPLCDDLLTQNSFCPQCAG